MTQHNPWKTLGSRVVYENAWIRVREDDVIRPDGKPGIYGVVETRIAAGIVALDEQDNVYLVGQFRYPLNEYSWEIIEGGTDGYEAPLAAAKRELKEEAGLEAVEWRQLGPEVHLSNCHSSEVAYFFLARQLSHTTAEPEGTEVLELRTLPFAASLDMVASGEIKDAMSIIGLMRAKHFLDCSNKEA